MIIELMNFHHWKNEDFDGLFLDDIDRFGIYKLYDALIEYVKQIKSD